MRVDSTIMAASLHAASKNHPANGSVQVSVSPARPRRLASPQMTVSEAYADNAEAEGLAESDLSGQKSFGKMVKTSLLDNVMDVSFVGSHVRHWKLRLHGQNPIIIQHPESQKSDASTVGITCSSCSVLRFLSALLCISLCRSRRRRMRSRVCLRRRAADVSVLSFDSGRPRFAGIMTSALALYVGQYIAGTPVYKLGVTLTDEL